MQMNRDAMLTQLSSEGETAGGTYNDGEEVQGWFGWSVELNGQGGGTLSVTYEDESAEPRTPVTQRWVLVPMGLAPVPLTPVRQPHTVEHPEGGFGG